MPTARISLLRKFVESLRTKDAAFKRSVLEGIEAMDYSEQPAGRAGMRRINNTKWAYTNGEKGIRLAYDNRIVELDEKTRTDITDNFSIPVYIEKLDALYFIIADYLISPHGRIYMPEGHQLIPEDKDIPKEIKGSIFAVLAGNKQNFISIRETGEGEYQWGYLFGKWGKATKIEPTGTGVKLFLLERGKPIAELFLPEAIRNENIESNDEYFTDPRDNKKYRIVKIGDQTWMAENLNWEGAGVTYENKKSNGKKYGRLYTWEEAMKSAPPGWHLPTDEEWTALTDFAGGWETAAVALKSEDGGGTDAFGFSALLGGYRLRGGVFYYVGDDGYWWSATEGDGGNACRRAIHSGDARVYSSDDYKHSSFSVRLLKD